MKNENELMTLLWKMLSEKQKAFLLRSLSDTFFDEYEGALELEIGTAAREKAKRDAKAIVAKIKKSK